MSETVFPIDQSMLSFASKVYARLDVKGEEESPTKILRHPGVNPVEMTPVFSAAQKAFILRVNGMTIYMNAEGVQHINLPGVDINIAGATIAKPIERPSIEIPRLRF